MKLKRLRGDVEIEKMKYGNSISRLVTVYIELFKTKFQSNNKKLVNVMYISILEFMAQTSIEKKYL